MVNENESDNKVCSCSYCSHCDCISSINNRHPINLKNNLISLNCLTTIKKSNHCYSSLSVSILVNAILLVIVFALNLMCMLKRVLLKLPKHVIGFIITVVILILCICCYFNTNFINNYFDPFYILITNNKGKFISIHFY